MSASQGITNDVLLSVDVANKEEPHPTRLYQYGGFLNALGVLSKGNMGSTYFYLGDDNVVGGTNYGLVNVALFLAQAAVETVQFDICDEISWEKDVFGKYAISNSCGQGRSVGLSTVNVFLNLDCPGFYDTAARADLWLSVDSMLPRRMRRQS